MFEASTNVARGRDSDWPAARTEAADLCVLHVLAPGTFGGLERVVHALSTGQAELGHSVHVAALLEAEVDLHPFTAGLSKTGVAVHGVVCPPRSYRAETQALKQLFLRLRPNVIHTHGYHADLVAGRVARQVGIPVVATVHGFTGGDWKNRGYEWLQRRALRRYDRVIAVSKPMVSQLDRSGVPRARVVVLPNAWSPTGEPMPSGVARQALQVEERAYHIGWVGRVTSEKGLDVLVEALPHLLDLPVVVSVIGDGGDRARNQQLAERLGVGSRLKWQGVRQDAWQFFQGFDLLTLSSRTEGTPIVLFEAMSAGIPIVATAVGGVPDVLSASEAFLVPPENPRALADAIRLAYRDPSSARGRAAAARQRLASDFNSGVWLARHTQLYRSLLH